MVKLLLHDICGWKVDLNFEFERRHVFVWSGVSISMSFIPANFVASFALTLSNKFVHQIKQ